MSTPRKHPIPTAGDRFGRLVVTDVPARPQNHTAVLCRCDCGREHCVRLENLVRGLTSSCGCLHKEAFTTRRHGESSTPLYACWLSLIQRCRTPSNSAYRYYGARGVKVAPEWERYEAFRDWARASGYAEGLEIDRRDNNRGYTPDNCRWVTRSTNMRNTRYNRLLTAFGETKTLAAWAEDPRCRVAYGRLHARITRQGWDAERAISADPT